jgi:hypothetical protein
MNSLFIFGIIIQNKKTNQQTNNEIHQPFNIYGIITLIGAISIAMFGFSSFNVKNCISMLQVFIVFI